MWCITANVTQRGRSGYTYRAGSDHASFTKCCQATHLPPSKEHFPNRANVDKAAKNRNVHTVQKGVGLGGWEFLLDACQDPSLAVSFHSPNRPSRVEAAKAVLRQTKAPFTHVRPPTTVCLKTSYKLLRGEDTLPPSIRKPGKHFQLLYTSYSFCASSLFFFAW